MLGQDLKRDVAVELRVGGPINLAHSSFANLGGDLVMGYLLADHLRNPGQILVQAK